MATSKTKKGKKDITKTDPSRRAYAKVKKKKPKVVAMSPVSTHVEKAGNGDTILTYMFPEKGVVKKPTLLIGNSNKRQFDITVKTISGSSQIYTVFTVGEGKHSLGDIPVKSGDRVMVNVVGNDDDLVIEDIWVAFTYTQGG